MPKTVIFVTGHHRAGTHTYAEHIAKKLNLPWLDERAIGLNDWKGLQLALNGKLVKFSKDGKKISVNRPELIEGFVLQCPFLAHKVLDLEKIGKVYWCTRSHRSIALSMANGSFGPMLWDIMKGFRDTFPKDSIWSSLKYDGREDVHYSFIGYAYLLTKVKSYFYKRRFHYKAKRIVLEEQPYYDKNSTRTSIRPAKPGALAEIERVKGLNESLCIH